MWPIAASTSHAPNSWSVGLFICLPSGNGYCGARRGSRSQLLEKGFAKDLADIYFLKEENFCNLNYLRKKKRRILSHN